MCQGQGPKPSQTCLLISWVNRVGEDEIFIFVGPTISIDRAGQYIKAIFLPPVQYGDIYRVTALYKPRVIGIVDGHFNQVPAVWHKEILWAIDQGIAVFGAASMGALRAAELDQFGMRGYGKIYEAYATGRLPPFNNEVFEDDDEVAIVHGPAEMGYLAASDAMVNIRMSLAKATQQNIIDMDSCQQLAQLAKSMFYADRQYATLLKQAKQQDVAHQYLAKLENWLPNNRVDQKQADAIAMLEAINAYTPNPNGQQNQKSSTFQHTSQWQTAIDEIDQLHAIESPALDELRLQGTAYFQTLDQALQTSFAGLQQKHAMEAKNLNELHQSPEALNKAFAAHWQRHTSRSTAASLSNTQCTQILLQYLNQTGKLDALTQRAKDKQAKLAEAEHKPTLEDLNEVDKLQLSDWYFSQQLGQEMPHQLEDYAFELGYRELDDFYAMILGEYLYQEISSADGNRS